MPKPIILAVDDDAQVLNAIERDLRQHYRNDYRIVVASSGADALGHWLQVKVNVLLSNVGETDERA